MKNNQKETQNTSAEELPEIKAGLSKVSINPTQNKIIFALFLVVVLIICYFFFFKKKETPVKNNHQTNYEDKLNKLDLSSIPVVRPDNTDNLQIVPIPKLPDPPPLVIPTPPPPIQTAPLAPPPITKSEHHNIDQKLPTLDILNSDDSSKKKSADTRRKSAIMLIGKNDGQATSTENLSSNTNIDYKPNLSNVQRVTKLPNLTNTIAEGKIIDTVLETSINTDLPGIVRGIVSRDVYGESGKNILIPKGSRLIGSYSSSIKMGQSRVAIIWNRIIRPDGIDLKINSNATDKLGHSGVEGMVDNKYFDILSNAILLSVINIGLASAAQKMTHSQPTTTVSYANGNAPVTSSTSSITETAVQNSVQSMTNTVSDLLKNSLEVKPSIFIDQGSIIKVLVNQDVTFPSDISSGMLMLK